MGNTYSSPSDITSQGGSDNSSSGISNAGNTETGGTGYGTYMVKPRISETPHLVNTNSSIEGGNHNNGPYNGERQFDSSEREGGKVLTVNTGAAGDSFRATTGNANLIHSQVSQSLDKLSKSSQLTRMSDRLEVKHNHQ